MKAAIVVFPGTNCEKDTFEACRYFGLETEYIWHNETNLKKYDFIFLPGGFSYGDYIHSGRLAKFSPVMQGIKEFICHKRGIVIGICNGFQILCESKILPGALTINISNRFICDDIPIYMGEKEITLPVAHKEGRYIFDKSTQISNLIFLKYKKNINGSMLDIAGLYDRQKRVIAMMPHPERAIFKETGSKDGCEIFNFIIKEL